MDVDEQGHVLCKIICHRNPHSRARQVLGVDRSLDNRPRSIIGGNATFQILFSFTVLTVFDECLCFYI